MAETRDPLVRNLEADELLFGMGDAKTHLYRVEAGAICVYIVRWDGKPEIVEHAFPGDLVGMGFLERHACSARATAPSRVRLLPLDAADSISLDDTRTIIRRREATEREFASRRDSLVKSGRNRPMIRLAALLTFLSRRNRGEGRDPNVIDDVLDGAVVADHLGVSFDVLANAVLHLDRLGLVKATPERHLRLMDVAALEALATDQSTADPPPVHPTF